jgi:hypothetical protein
MRIHTTYTRDAALRELNRINRPQRRRSMRSSAPGCSAAAGARSRPRPRCARSQARAHRGPARHLAAHGDSLGAGVVLLLPERAPRLRCWSNAID